MLPRNAVTFDIRDASTGRPMPGKLSFVGIHGTPLPQFTHRDVGLRIEGGIAAYHRVMSLSGEGRVEVPHGHYQVTVSRGPEWDAVVIPDLHVGAAPVAIQASLHHVVDTTGWISADFHVHSAASSDCRVPMEDRIFEFASDGVDMLVSTDHNYIADYAPLIEELGAQDVLASMPGDEITTGLWGHFGAMPLAPDAGEAGQGAPQVRHRNIAQIFGGLRKTDPAAFIQVNHPRLDAEIGYFDLTGFNAASERAPKRMFSFDFDAIEVLNGYQDADRRSIERNIEDWFLLLSHGRRITATGNSDTHHLHYNLGGYPRNYVQVPDGDPRTLKGADVARAVRAGRSFFTTGPFVKVTAGASGTAGLGDLVPAPGGQAELDIEVQAAPWVEVGSVTLYLNGVETQRFAVDPGDATALRFKKHVSVKLERDTFAVVRVDGNRLMWPVVGDGAHFGVRALALTNPIYFDTNGNRRFDAPKPLK